MENGLTSSGSGASASDDAAHLLQLIATLSRELRSARDTPRVSLDSRLGEDLGFDSLGRTELLLRIERTFSVSLPGSTLAEAETPADLWRALEAADAQRGRATLPPLADAAPGPVESIPDAAATLTEVLDWHAETHPDRVHTWLREREDHIETVTYARLRETALAVSGGILDAGVAPGARVALMLPTCAGFLHAFFGILYAGCVPVPIYPPARPSQLADHLRRQAAILANAGAELLVTVPEARVLAAFLRSKVASLRAVETVEGLRGRGRPEAAPAPDTGDVAFLQYTSGSTGDPKGVVLSHANLLANIRAMGRAMEAEPGRDVFVSWLPLYHDMGLIGAWLGSLHFAVPVSIMSPLIFLARPESWLWEIHDRRATLSGAPNFAFDLCVERIDDGAIEGLDLSSARIVVNGAEPVRAASVRAFCERFAAHGFDPGALAPVYGLAECSVGLAFPRPGRGLLAERIDRTELAERSRAVPVTPGHGEAIEVVACGSPLPGHQFRAVDESGREVPERRQGRLQFTGPSATAGYHDNPRATRELFDGDWLETGDLAYVAGGEVFPTGRIKDVIIRGGRNIHPHELEAAIGDLPGIRRGCVAVFAAAGPDSGGEAGGGRRNPRGGRQRPRPAEARHRGGGGGCRGHRAGRRRPRAAPRGAQDLERQDPAHRHPRALPGGPSRRTRRCAVAATSRAVACGGDGPTSLRRPPDARPRLRRVLVGGVGRAGAGRLAAFDRAAPARLALEGAARGRARHADAHRHAVDGERRDRARTRRHPGRQSLQLSRQPGAGRGAPRRDRFRRQGGTGAAAVRRDVAAADRRDIRGSGSTTPAAWAIWTP